MLDKFVELINKYLTPVAVKIKKIKWLSAISDGVMATLPLLMIGSLATVITSIPNDTYLEWLATTPLQHICSTISSLTTGIMGLVACIATSYAMAEKIETDKLSSCFISVSAFLVLQGFSSGSISITYLGAQGLIFAMIIGVLIPYTSKIIIGKGLYVRMPAGVPPMVERTFAAIVPCAVVVIIASIIEFCFASTEYGNIIAWFYEIIQRPFTNVGLSFPSICFLAIFGSLINFLGIHNAWVTNLWVPLLYAASAENIAAFEAGNAIPNLISDPFRSYIFLGGTGALFGLEIAMLFFCKSQRIKKVSRIAALPCIFNINEPILFGLPIMMNPVLLIPFTLAPLANVIIAYVVHLSGLVPVLNGAIISWAMPTYLRIFIAGGGLAGVVLVTVLIIVDLLIYLPFIKVVDSQYLNEEKSNIGIESE